MLWLILALSLAALAFLISLFAFLAAFYSPARFRTRDDAIPAGAQYREKREHMLSLIRGMEALPCEEIRIPAFDGVSLRARYYHLRDGAPLQIEMHGYRGAAVRDFCGGHALARELGMNVLSVDQRAHGESGGKVITFGIRERLDCQSWAQYAFLRFGPETPTYLAGVSMGAATVLMASALKLPHTVRGIIADSPYTEPEAIIRKVISKDAHLPAGALLPLLRFGARLFGRFDLRGASALEAVGRTEIPILLIHGEEDRFVPCDMSRELAAACAGPHGLETFPGAGHGLSYIVDPERYKKAVEEFMRQ